MKWLREPDLTRGPYFGDPYPRVQVRFSYLYVISIGKHKYHDISMPQYSCIAYTPVNNIRVSHKLLI